MDESKRCTATSKRTGQRCGLARIPGTTVCTKHGGAAPQVRATCPAAPAGDCYHDHGHIGEFRLTRLPGGLVPAAS